MDEDDLSVFNHKIQNPCIARIGFGTQELIESSFSVQWTLSTPPTVSSYVSLFLLPALLRLSAGQHFTPCSTVVWSAHLSLVCKQIITKTKFKMLSQEPSGFPLVIQTLLSSKTLVTILILPNSCPFPCHI